MFVCIAAGILSCCEVMCGSAVWSEGMESLNWRAGSYDVAMDPAHGSIVFLGKSGVHLACAFVHVRCHPFIINLHYAIQPPTICLNKKSSVGWLCGHHDVFFICFVSAQDG